MQETMADRSELETRAETAQALRIAVRSVDRLLAARQLEGVKIGRCHMVKVASRKALAARGVAKITHPPKRAAP
jgi:hypothetical protein